MTADQGMTTAGQYAVTIALKWDGQDWNTVSAEMPNLRLANADAGDLARQAVRAFAYDYQGRDAALTLVMRLPVVGKGE